MTDLQYDEHGRELPTDVFLERFFSQIHREVVRDIQDGAYIREFAQWKLEEKRPGPIERFMQWFEDLSYRRAGRPNPHKPPPVTLNPEYEDQARYHRLMAQLYESKAHDM